MLTIPRNKVGKLEVPFLYVALQVRLEAYFEPSFSQKSSLKHFQSAQLSAQTRK